VDACGSPPDAGGEARVGVRSVGLIIQAKEHSMYARVTTGQVQPGTTEDLMPLYEAAAHQQQAMQGFISTQLLIDRAANKFLIVTLCETLTDLEASDTVPRQTLADPRVVAALAGPPVIAVYEVAAQVAR
jgi:heme-degrading monooxygenase HmoA